MAGYIGAKVGTVTANAADIKGDISATDTTPEITLKNTTETDADGSRSGKITFKGEQSGGEESTLAQIESAHDGTLDDEKGDLIFKTNDGSDGASPTDRVRIVSNGSILTATLGTDNVHLGEGAGASIASGGNQNTLIGKDAGTALTTGDDNVAVGHSALSTEDANGRNTAVGYEALKTLNAGADGENVAVGYRAGKALTEGIQNTLIGVQAGDALTHADYNVAVGRNALSGDTQGHKSTAVGVGALNVQNHTSSTDTHNTAVGYNAGTAVTTATRNTVVGSNAGASNQTSLYNTYVGYGAGQSTTGQGNTFIGDASGNSVVAGEFNTLLGQQAGNAITSGDKNTIIGRFTGNDGGLDIRTSSNNIVLSDGDGNPRGVFSSGGNYGVGQVNGLGSVNSATNGAVLGAQGYGMFQRAGSTVGYFNRNTNDGLLISFYGTGTQEGTISISGTTVSYNGGHLSRWSQLADNTKDTSIVKGTVMTNLDQMAVWTHAAKEVGDDILDVDGNVIGQETEAQDAWTEDNEQLNCMAVSSVEGDPNVAGVFVNWDEDDTDFVNDMNVAMTGDMVIRIAQGVTVARGDLLMSAGDGTAKPQGDDIVRSKTIAKVTSTNVSHTYDDGSFLVPCVLMAC